MPSERPLRGLDRIIRPAPRARATAVLVASALALAYVGAVTAWMYLNPADEDLRTNVSDIVPIPLHLFAILVLIAVARRTTGKRERRGWILLAMAFGAYGLGDVAWCVLEVGMGQSPFPSVADFGYLVYYPLLAAGLLHLTEKNVERGHLLRARLDIGIVVLGGFIIVYYVLLGPTLQAAEPNTLASILSVAYPVGDVFLLYAVAALMVRGSTSLDPMTLGVLVASQVSFFVADLAFGAASSNDTYSPGSWVDSVWLLAVAFMAIGAMLHRVRWRERLTFLRTDAPRRRPAWLPYLALAGGYSVVAYVSVSQAVYPVGGVMICAAGLTGLVIARQVSAIRENGRLLDALQVLATTDSLTGLANRGRFYELAPEVVEAARTDGQPIAMLMIDLDHFKTINDTFGHAVGDQAIQLVASACRAGSPQGSIVARYGGDEIIALMPGIDARRALDHAGRIQQAVNDIRLEADPDRQLTVSIGVAAMRDANDVEALAGQADAALYKAKHDGRARASMAN